MDHMNRDTALELLRKAAPQLVELEYETWNFGDSTGFEALLRASDTLGQPELGQFAYGFFRAWATRAEPFERLDCTAPGLAIVLAAEKSGNDQLLAEANRLATYLTSRPTLHGVYETWERSPLMEPYGGDALPDDEKILLDASPPGIFVDCLHFDPPFFAGLARVTGDSAWAEEALEQARGYIAVLQKESGLFDHFALRGVPDRTFGPGWGRGQGWALLGMLDVVEQLDLPADHDISQAAVSLIDAMVALQRPDGHWAVVITDLDSGDEPSTAAFMAAGFLRAARRGLISGDRYGEAVDRALDALGKDVDGGGLLAGVSRAVMACTTPSHYAHVPRGFNVPWGQGPLVLALCEAVNR
jgi:unsaturated rhamnogalacturonyl hydrolase